VQGCMRRTIGRRVAVLLLPLFSWAAAEQHAHEHATTATPLSDGPPITITINPEARVSAALGGALPAPTQCGSANTLSLKIVNQGFVTAKLEAQFAGDAPAGATLTFQPEPLKGVPEELRSLRITLTQPGPTDVTIAFRAHNALPDIGGRDRVHFLLHCLPPREPLNRGQPAS
jgi:hypothetical protein